MNHSKNHPSALKYVDIISLLRLRVQIGEVEASASLRVIDYLNRMREKEENVASAPTETVTTASDELHDKAISAVQLNSENVSELVAVLQVHISFVY